MKYTYLSLALLLMLSQSSNADTALNAASNYNFPGGVVELRIDKQSKSLPDVKFGVQEPVIIDHPESWRVFIGLNLDTIPGEYLLYLKRSIDGASSEHINFFVEQKSYPVLEYKKGIEKQVNQIHSSFSELEFSNTQQPNLPLSLPASGQWNSEFGSIYHNKKRKKLITQNQIFLPVSNNIVSVRSPENALVSKIITDDKDISTVFLDHGRGLFSIVGGLTEISVQTGNGVLSGAVIGKVTPEADFKSATVSTRTLTWQCILNGTYVNPTILTKL